MPRSLPRGPAGDVLPTGGTVAAGRATIGAPINGGLTINQTSAAPVINWNAFSVGQSNSVTFVQPNASSATLNRVTGATTSTIAGSITANGSVYLVNPNGIQITSTGRHQYRRGIRGVDAGHRQQRFHGGQGAFAGNGASASVSNAGKIVTGPGGFVALLGGSVSNSGLISAPLGKIGLGSGERRRSTSTATSSCRSALPTNATDANGQALVTNSGKLKAKGGQVVLTAATVKEAVRDAINMPGSISASSVSGKNGSIILDGGAGGNVAVSGKIVARRQGRPVRRQCRAERRQDQRRLQEGQRRNGDGDGGRRGLADEHQNHRLRKTGGGSVRSAAISMKVRTLSQAAA